MTQSEVNRALDKIHLVAGHAQAHIMIDERGQEAHDYCHKYNLPLGSIVWHAILDDAIKLRRENESLKSTSKD